MYHSDLKGLRRFDNLRFDESDLGSALFHIKDVEAFERQHPELFKETPYAQASPRIADLEAQLAKARQEIERLKDGGNGEEAAPGSCDDCPAKMKAEVNLKVFKVGVGMALRCASDGDRQSKEGHLTLWRELFGWGKTGKPYSRYFDAFRQALDEAPHLKHPDPKQK